VGVTRGASSSDWRIWCRQVSASIDRRPSRPVILLRGLPARAGLLRRFQTDSRAGSARDEKKPAVVMSNTYADLQDFTGATGLEPATSGVTGRSWRLRVCPGIGGNSPRERGISPLARYPLCGHRRALAAASQGLRRDERGMSRRLIRQHPLLLRSGVRNSRPGECRFARPCVRAAGPTGHVTIPEEVVTCSPGLTASRSPIAHVGLLGPEYG
jgi:hypothetical protein